MKKNRTGRTNWCTDEDIIDLVRALARHMPDQTIASVDKKWPDLNIGEFIKSPSLKFKAQMYGAEAVANPQ